jgi:hypothetical protein
VIILRGSLEDGGANDCDDKTLKQYWKHSQWAL